MRILAQPAFMNRNANPYNWLLYKHMAALGVDVHDFSPSRLLKNKYAIWHRHWPEWHLSDTNVIKSLAKTQTLLHLMDFARSRGVKTVWTVHNLSTHEQFYPKREACFWKAFTCRLDGYISLSKTGMEAAQDRFPELKNIPGFVIPHGHYRLEYPDYLSPQETRVALGISPRAEVLLFFGQIRSYKNVPQLIRTFRQVPNSEAMLYIVGHPDSPKLAEEIKKEAALDLRVQLHLDFIPKDKVQLYLRAADLVILPYHEILNSGSVLLALSFDRPVLVPLQGSLGELQAQVGKEWVRTYTGDITPLQIAEALQWAASVPRPKQAPIDVFEWQELARQTINAYNAIAARSSD
jgi:glycosyltransferase involved in cell wall biosynthesis